MMSCVVFPDYLLFYLDLFLLQINFIPIYLRK